MQYRDLGNTGLKVSEIGLGCEGLAEDQCRAARPLLDAAEKHGINYIDLYTPDPEVRSSVGAALAGRRERFILQSHICSVWKNDQYMRTRKIEEVKNGMEDMLSRLQTDYIDVGMIHYVDSMKDWDAVANGPVLQYALGLREKGTIRHIGLSSHNPQVALKAIESVHIEVQIGRASCRDRVSSCV